MRQDGQAAHGSDEDTRRGISDALQAYGHDIRSAVSDVLGAIRLIDAQRLDDETRTQFERLSAASESLAGLVDAALMAAAGETAILGPQEEVALAALTGAWRSRWTGRAAELGMGFELRLEPGLPDVLRVPRMPLERIVGNLVGNALIHSGGTRVRLEITATPEGGIDLAVADEGPGLPGLDLAAATAAVPPTALGEGHGLGLRIVERLSRQIGADLGIARGGALGGAVITLRIPAGRVGPSARATAIAPDPPDLTELRILVAEDNSTNRTILRQMLEAMGAAPVFASDGAEALAEIDRAMAGDATRAPYDIALIDVEMPNVSGLQAMRAIRGREDAAAGMPVVALTAYVLRDNREAIYDAGADGIIGKPVSSPEDFGRAILRYAGRPAGLPEPEDVLSLGAGDRSFGEKMNEAVLDDLLSIAGPEGARELLDRLSEDLCSILAQLDAGIAARSVSVVRAQTHILVAISGSVGADRLCRLSEVLNIAAKRRRLADFPALFAPCRQDLTDLMALIDARRAGPG